MSNNNRLGRVDEGTSRLLPASYMVGFVAIFSLVPLVIDKGLHGSNPLLFNAGLAFGKIIGVLAWVSIACPWVLFDKEVLRLIRHRIISKAMLLGSISHLTYAFFAWSTVYVDTAVSTIVYETWPILYMTLLVKLSYGEKRQSRYRKMSIFDYGLCLLAFFGLAYVTVGTSSVQDLDTQIHGGYQALGIALALGAAGVASLNAYNFQWGCNLRTELPKRVAPDGTCDIEELACVMIAFALSSLLVLPGSVALGLGAGGGISTFPLLVSIISGAVLLSAGSICFRKANLQTSDPSINVLAYTAPVVALIWLAAFSEIEVANKQYLVIGTIAIVAMNLLLNVDPEELIDDTPRFGFRVLVASLWIFGAIVYTRDTWITFEHLLWPTDQYWSILALSATIFTLLLSFRVSRVSQRISEEDRLTTSVLRKLEKLRREGVIDEELVERFAAMGYPTVDSVREVYVDIRTAIQDAQRNDTLSKVDLLSVEIEVDTLMYSKQRGREFGELVSIITLGLITIGIAVLSRPSLAGWTGFLAEMFIMIFSSTIAYLVVNLADLRRDRFARVFRTGMVSVNKWHAEKNYMINFHEEGTFRLDTIIALTVSGAMIIAFGYVFLQKWLV